MAEYQQRYTRQNLGGGGVTVSDWSRVTEHIESMCNPNLLINADFRNPVNQRGQNEYTTDGYCIDMWRVDRASIIIENEKIVVATKHGNGNSEFVQKIENSKCLSGKRVTLSAKFENDSIICGFIDIPFEDSYDISAYWHKDFTLNLIKRSEFAEFRIILGEGNTSKLIAAKLELGTVSTLANEVVDYAAEFRKCQRYLQVLNYHTDYYTAGIGYTINTTSVRAFMPSVVPMRLNNPTISSLDAAKWTIYCAGTKIIPTAVNVWYAGVNTLGFKFTGTFPAAYEPCTVTYDTGEKLLISAEL